MLIKKSADGRVEFELNLQIYPKERILGAVNNFKDVCRISLRDNIIVIKTIKKEDNAENIAYEFSNYLLGLVAPWN